MKRFNPEHAHKLERAGRLEELPPANIARLLDLDGSQTVVDFGAGTGMYTLPIAEALPRGGVIAVDAEEELLALIHEKLEGHPAAERVTTALFADGRTALPDGVADRLFMVNALHHIHDDRAALAEIVRLLTPGGLLLSVDYARMERPVGPSNDHVIELSEARATLAGAGLEEVGVYLPGEVGRYSIAVAARKPAP